MGIPASGKSSLCREIASQLDRASLLHFDEVLSEEEGTERERRKRAETKYRDMLFILESGDILLVDDVFHLKSMRRPLLRASRRARAVLGWLRMDVDLEEAIKRDRRRREGERVGEETIRKIAREAEWSREGEEKSFIYRSGVSSLEEVIDWIQQIRRDQQKEHRISFREIKSVEPKAKHECTEKETQEMLLKRVVGEMMREGEQLNGKLMSEARKRVAKQLEVGMCIEKERMRSQLLHEYHALEMGKMNPEGSREIDSYQR